MSYSLEVHLHKDTFVNGEVVTGYVTLDLTTTLTVTVVKMRVGGFEKALFYVPPNSDSYLSMPIFCIENIIFSPKMNEQEMEPGTYNFPFTFELPFHLAPSFNYIDSAAILYGMQSFLEAPNKALPPEDTPPKTTDFFVYGTKKQKWLAVVSESRPITAKSSKASLFSKSKPVEISVCIRRSDFMIGENIVIHTQVRNHSSTPLNCIQAHIIQTVRIDTENFQKVLSRAKVAANSVTCAIPQYAPSLPTPYVKLELPIRQVFGDESVFPTAKGKVVRVEHSLVVTLPGTDIQCNLPIALWDEVANYLQEEVKVEEGMIEWETEWLPVWVDDEAVDKCTLCNQSFSVFNRKHHCRSCGLVMCADCTPHKEAMKHLGYDEPVRICTKCNINIPASTSPTNISFFPPYTFTPINPNSNNNNNNNNNLEHSENTKSPPLSRNSKQETTPASPQRQRAT